MELTPGEINVMTQVGDGVDVWDRGIAVICRNLQKRNLVRIVKAKRAPKKGAAQQPFFGAKLTAAGWRELFISNRATTGKSK